MTPHDFWNLAGRAGRWGQDFHGNIVCVDPNDDLDEAAVLARLRSRRWEGIAIPKVVKRELTEVLARLDALAA